MGDMGMNGMGMSDSGEGDGEQLFEVRSGGEVAPSLHSEACSVLIPTKWADAVDDEVVSESSLHSDAYNAFDPGAAALTSTCDEQQGEGITNSALTSACGAQGMVSLTSTCNEKGTECECESQHSEVGNALDLALKFECCAEAVRSILVARAFFAWKLKLPHPAVWPSWFTAL